MGSGFLLPLTPFESWFELSNLGFEFLVSLGSFFENFVERVSFGRVAVLTEPLGSFDLGREFLLNGLSGRFCRLGSFFRILSPRLFDQLVGFLESLGVLSSIHADVTAQNRLGDQTDERVGKAEHLVDFRFDLAFHAGRIALENDFSGGVDQGEFGETVSRRIAGTLRGPHRLGAEPFSLDGHGEDAVVGASLAFDEDDLDLVAVFLLQLNRRRNRRASAGPSPGSPEVDQNRFPSQVSEAGDAPSIERNLTEGVFRAIPVLAALGSERGGEEAQAQAEEYAMIHDDIIVGDGEGTQSSKGIEEESSGQAALRVSLPPAWWKAASRPPSLPRESVKSGKFVSETGVRGRKFGCGTGWRGPGRWFVLPQEAVRSAPGGPTGARIQARIGNRGLWVGRSVEPGTAKQPLFSEKGRVDRSAKGAFKRERSQPLAH